MPAGAAALSPGDVVWAQFEKLGHWWPAVVARDADTGQTVNDEGQFFVMGGIGSNEERRRSWVSPSALRRWEATLQRNGGTLVLANSDTAAKTSFVKPLNQAAADNGAGPISARRRPSEATIVRIGVGDLPAPALRHILLAVQSDNLLRHVSICARVCAEWRRIVLDSAAYGRELAAGVATLVPGATPGCAGWWRAHVMRTISQALDGGDGQLRLADLHVGDAGAAVLAAALQVVPRDRFCRLWLTANAITAAGVRRLAPALQRPELRWLVVRNATLGDDGVAALAAALPPTLEHLDFGFCGCGDRGFEAMATALPALTRLKTLICDSSVCVGGRGWAALASALPSLPALEQLVANDCTGLGIDGVTALAAAVPQCCRLRWLSLNGSFRSRAQLEQASAVMRGVSRDGLGVALHLPLRLHG